MMENVPLEWLAAWAHDDEHLRHLVEFKLTSYLCVPLVSASGTLGAMTFAYAESGRHYHGARSHLRRRPRRARALAFENALAYRRAHDANRLKDEFLATLSHELRTPLNAIIGYAHMLNMGILNGERQAKAIAVVKRNSEALGQIIADVLDVSRITSGKLRLDVRPVDLEDILRNAIATMQPAADAKGVSLALQVDPTVARATGDPDRLQQVVWNLLSNAVKFTPRGGHVQIGLEQTRGLRSISSCETMVKASIRRFCRTSSSDSDWPTADRRASTAGWAWAWRSSGSWSSCTAEASRPTSDGPGKGATFRVRLPRTIAESRRAAREAKVFTPPPDQELPRLLRGVRILAVDDEEDALGLLRVVLESAGADVTTARSAPEAIELLKASLYHAVIADIAMPRTDGLQLIRIHQGAAALSCQPDSGRCLHGVCAFGGSAQRPRRWIPGAHRQAGEPDRARPRGGRAAGPLTAPTRCASASDSTGGVRLLRALALVLPVAGCRLPVPGFSSPLDLHILTIKMREA